MVIMLSIFGHKEYPSETFQNAVKGIKETLKIVNTHLEGKDYLVGNTLTIADIALFGATMASYGLVLDAGFRKAMPNAAGHFERLSKLPEFV